MEMRRRENGDVEAWRRQPWLPPLGGCSVREDKLNKPIGFEEGSYGEDLRVSGQNGDEEFEEGDCGWVMRGDEVEMVFRVLRVGRQPWLPPLGGCSVRENELNKLIGFEEGSCGEVVRRDELDWG